MVNEGLFKFIQIYEMLTAQQINEELKFQIVFFLQNVRTLIIIFVFYAHSFED